MTDPLITAAQFLTTQLDWLRWATDEQGAPYATSVFAEIADCASKLRGTVNGPSDQKYLGPCGAYVITAVHGDEIGDVSGHECDGDVYGRPDAEKGTCRTCGAQVDQAERRAWLDGQVRASDRVFRAAHIADALRINVKTIRGWANPHRSDTGAILRPARLASYWQAGEHIVPWAEPREGEDVKARGHRLFYVADVVKLAGELAEQRARRNREGASA